MSTDPQNIPTNEYFDPESVSSSDGKIYFGEREERALVDYCNCSDEKCRESIFNDILYPAFTRMIECQIRSYKLFVIGENYKTTMDKALSYLVSKLNLFDPAKGTKGYSYFGTICKRYLISERKNSMCDNGKLINLDVAVKDYNAGTISDDDGLNPAFSEGLTEYLVSWLKKVVRNDNPYDVLTDNEIQVGKVLIYIFEDPDRYIEILECMNSHAASNSTKKTGKHKRATILAYIQESTGLSSHEVKAALRRFKILYKCCKSYYRDMLEN